MQYTTKQLKLSNIELNDYNPNRMADSHYNALKNNIKQDGYLQPLLINHIDDKYVIIDGEHRYKALKELGFDKIDCWIISIPEAEAKKLTLKMGLSGEYDPVNLSGLLDSMLTDIDIDIPTIELDMPHIDLSLLDMDINNQDDKNENEDNIPEVETKKVITKTGDIWLLGKHRILCGDSTSEKDVKLLMDGIKAEMCFTDPPYGVDYDGTKRAPEHRHLHRPKLIGDNSTILYTKVIPIIAKYCKGPCYTWYADKKPIALFEAVEKVGTAHSVIVWVKDNAAFSMNAHYKYNHEICLYWKPKGCTLLWSGNNNQTTVWEVQAVNSMGNVDDSGVKYGSVDHDSDSNSFSLHPTQKPVKLAEIAIANHTGETVLDLFLGSGSTLIGAHKLGRICYGMELEPRYIDVIVKRYVNYVKTVDDIYLIRKGKKIKYNDVIKV